MPSPALDLKIPVKRLRDISHSCNLGLVWQDRPVHLDGTRVELELLQHAVVGVAQEGEAGGDVAYLGQLVPQQRVLVVEPLQRLALPPAEQEIVYLLMNETEIAPLRDG